jgi:hypothetical protein
MKELEVDLQQVRDELAVAQAEHARLTAKIVGLQAQRDALIRALAGGPEPRAKADVDVTTLTKDQAIVGVLRQAAGPMRIKEIVEAMTAAGRTETYNGVSVYLDTLVKTGQVIRVSRGRYVATWPPEAAHDNDPADRQASSYHSLRSLSGHERPGAPPELEPGDN